MDNTNQINQRRSELSAAKRALLEKRLRGASGGGKEADQPIPRRSGSAPIPLSFVQQRLWFLSKLEPKNPFYNIFGTALLIGSLDIGVLERSIATVIERHESLRTNFADVDGQASQVILPTSRFRLEQIDLGSHPPATYETVLRHHIEALMQQPFTLGEGLLFRAILLRLDEQHHGILFLMHHIISDGWSIGIFNHEFALSYQALAQGRTPALPDLPIQYADYAVWQQQWLAPGAPSGALDKHLRYWRKQLADIQPLFPLPTDFPRPPVQTFVGAHYPFPLPAELVASATALGRQESATLFMVLLAVFQILLARYSGQDDVLVGTPSANRTRPELESVIGMFVSTLALRVDLGGQPSFRALLRRVRDVTASAYEHQDLPFEQLLEELQHPRSLSYSPIFQIFFALQNVPSPPVDLPGLRISRFETTNNSVKFDLTLNIEEQAGGGLMAWLDYSTDLFEAATIERMAGHYRALLEAILANPDQPITQLPMLTTAEHELLSGWNATGVPFESTACIQQLFEAQVDRTPEAIALVAAGTPVTYAELNTQANRLAHHLRAQGIDAESYVAVCLDRSPELIVSLLAVLKAGGAYIPLDPNYPAERLTFILDDAQPRAVLTDATHAYRFSGTAPLLIQLDEAAAQIAAAPETNPEIATQPDNLAYLIYTSGSVGQPKGVMVAHRSLVHYAEAARSAYDLTAADRVLQFASISFDASAEEIYPTLTTGGTLVLRDDQMLTTAANFLRRAEEWRLSVISLPTAYWHELTSQIVESKLALPSTLRLVIIGGEEAMAERVVQWREQTGDRVRLMNTYGPTEATIVATMCAVDALPSDVTSVPIGRPIQNMQAYVLDAQLNPVPVGVPGELYLGGAGVARGYLNQPVLTAERFLPNPFAQTSGDRLYRSGDRVRYRADGALEFLGRSDFQVKIRGFRIEPGEIEQRLSEHPDVEAAVVIVHEPQPGDRRLVAYVVAKENQEDESEAGSRFLVLGSELRAFLKTRLPDYMLPSLIIPLAALPLTSSGKLARSALPAPEEAALARQASYAPPEDALQAQLVRIWESTLNRSPISITDNFFDIGGTSLLSIRLISRIEERMGQSLPLRALYAAPTIKELVAYLHERGWPGVLRLVDDLPEIRSPLVKIQPNGSKRPFFFVAPLGGIVPANVLVGFMDLVPYFGLDQPFYGLQLPGVALPLLKHMDSQQMPDAATLSRHILEFAPSRQIIEEGAAQCIVAMREIQPEGPYLIGGFCSGGVVALEIAQQLRRQGQEIGFLGLIDTSATTTAGFQVDTSEAALLAFAQKRIAHQIHQIEFPDTGDIAWFIRKDLGWATIKKDLEVIYAELNQLDPQAYWAYCLNELKTSGTVSQEATEQEIYRLFQMYQMNKLGSHYVLSTYAPQVYDDQVSLFMVEQDAFEGDPIEGWRPLSTLPIDLNIIPGDHGTLFLEPNIQGLAQQLLAKLAQVDQPVAS